MKMIKVTLKNDSKDEFEKAMKIFKKSVNNDGLIREVMDRRFFVKPSKRKHDAIRKIEKEREKNKRKKK